jgi:hypothetical protein
MYCAAAPQVNDCRRGHIRGFDVAANGMLARQTDRVFADLRDIYCGGAGCIYTLDPKDKRLGPIVHG